MKTKFHTTDEIVDGKIDVPLDIGVIPNHMGINLCAVEGMSWTQQDDGQLVSLTIHFIPSANLRQVNGAQEEEDPYAPLPTSEALEAFDKDAYHPRSWRDVLGAPASLLGVLGILGFNGQCITFTPNSRIEMANAVRNEHERAQQNPLFPRRALAPEFAKGKLGYPTYEVACDTIHERIAGVVVLKDPLIMRRTVHRALAGQVKRP